MALNNSTIIGRFLLNGTNDYQQRIPDPVQAGMTATARALFDPLNRDIYNNFANWLVQVPSFAYARNHSFENGLKQFVKERSFNGNFMEMQVAWVKAHSYRNDVSDILTTHYPKGEQVYHQLDYKLKYPLSIAREDMMTAFTGENGLSDLIASIMQSGINTDEYDVYNSMLQLVGEYDRDNKIYTVHYDNVPSTVDDARSLLRDMVAWAQRIKFPSTAYNASSIATFASPEDMVLLVTPEIYGAIGVQGLGMLFNRADGEVPYRTVVVNKFPIDGVFAVLMDESWFQCENVLYENTSFYDPSKLVTNYWLHHWMTLSTSPFAPIIAFGTREVSEEPIVVKQTVTGLTIAGENSVTTVKAGGTLPLTVKLTGSIAPESDGVEVKPDAATFEVTGATAEKATVRLGSRTYVDYDNGAFVLHVSKTVPTGTVLTVKGASTYANPNGSTTNYTATTTITVS